jgi:hypothetical protein
MIGGTKCSLVFERWHHATKCGRVAAKDRPPAETNFGLRMLPQWSSGRVRKVSRFNVGVTVNTAYETFRTYQYQITVWVLELVVQSHQERKWPSTKEEMTFIPPLVAEKARRKMACAIQVKKNPGLFSVNPYCRYKQTPENHIIENQSKQR